MGLWYAFRPEKLIVNKKVDEPAPAALARLTPLYTGSFHGDAHETTGRATAYQEPSGSRELTLSSFTTSSGPALHVILLDGSNVGRGQDLTLSNTNNRDLGELRAIQGEQNYALPADIDLNRFNTVVIYSAGLHTIFGTATLDAF